MLSYQHAYHAGNRADVHKHIALVLLLRRLQRKDAALCYLDSHAGRGVYDLESQEARRTREAEDGILRLARAERPAKAGVLPAAAALPAKADSPDAATELPAKADGPDAADPPTGVRAYLDLIASFNPSGRLRYYPGSAALARALLRAQDRAILFELHPQERAALKTAVAGDPRVSVHARDSYEGLPALLPPPIRRGLVLIDPSYEVKREYESVVDLIEKSLACWATGIYLLWYPLLHEARHGALLARLAAIDPPNALISEYRFSHAAAGLQGSGIVIVNTPWQLDESLAEAMRHIAAALRSAGNGRYEQRWIGPRDAES